MLEVPHKLARVGIEGQGRIEIERVVRHPFLVDEIAQRPGVVGVAGTEEREVVDRIVTPWDPDRAPVSLFEGEPVPAVTSGLARTGDRIEAPGLFTRLGIEGHHVGAAVDPPRGADHDLAFGDEWATRHPGTCFRIPDLGVPDHLARLDVERDDVDVGCRDIQTIPID